MLLTDEDGREILPIPDASPRPDDTTLSGSYLITKSELIIDGMVVITGGGILIHNMYQYIENPNYQHASITHRLGSYFLALTHLTAMGFEAVATYDFIRRMEYYCKDKLVSVEGFAATARTVAANHTVVIAGLFWALAYKYAVDGPAWQNLPMHGGLAALAMTYLIYNQFPYELNWRTVGANALASGSYAVFNGACSFAKVNNPDGTPIYEAVDFSTSPKKAAIFSVGAVIGSGLTLALTWMVLNPRKIAGYTVKKYRACCGPRVNRDAEPLLAGAQDPEQAMPAQAPKQSWRSFVGNCCNLFGPPPEPGISTGPASPAERSLNLVHNQPTRSMSGGKW